MSKKHVSLEVVNPYAAGIDIGSRSHWVAVGQDAQDVREFGVYTEDHQELSKWLTKHEVTTIAMESTGTYWQNVFSFLVSEGFEVILVNGRQTKNIIGKSGVAFVKLTKKSLPTELKNYNSNKKNLEKTLQNRNTQIYNAIKDNSDIVDNRAVFY